MRDEKKWRLAVVQFQAIRANIPNYISEAFVREYHAVLDQMSEASGEDFDSFRIPSAELKPRVVSFQIGGYRGGPGRVNHSKENYCDFNLFQRRIDALTGYLPHIEESMRQPQVPDDSKDYWSMSDAQLEGLARKFNIGGYGHQYGIDRDIIIKGLRERDRAMQPETSPNRLTNYGTIVGSNFQQGSHGSSAVVNYSVQEEKEFIARVRTAILGLTLNDEQSQALEIDLATAELQLNSGNPKRMILNECWSSVRNILEQAAGTVVAAPLLYELTKLLR